MPADDAARPVPHLAPGVTAPGPGAPHPGSAAPSGGPAAGGGTETFAAVGDRTQRRREPGSEDQRSAEANAPGPPGLSAPGLECVDPSALAILPAELHHAPGIVALRDTLARWMQARGIDQWREGEFAQQHVAQEIARGEWWVIADPQQPERVLASVRVIWEDLPIWGEQPEPAGYIHGVAVDRALRGTGTGTRLIRAAERAIAASGRLISRLDCDESNPVLEPFYAGLGYTPRGAVDFDVPGMDYRVRVLRMERSLSERAR